MYYKCSGFGIQSLVIYWLCIKFKPTALCFHFLMEVLKSLESMFSNTWNSFNTFKFSVHLQIRKQLLSLQIDCFHTCECLWGWSVFVTGMWWWCKWQWLFCESRWDPATSKAASSSDWDCVWPLRSVDLRWKRFTHLSYDDGLIISSQMSSPGTVVNHVSCLLVVH